jgi:hypothetical protein
LPLKLPLKLPPEVAWIEPALLAEWAQAYDGVLGERFRLEAQASLPLVGGGAEVEEVYAGVRVQRLRLRFDLGMGNGGSVRATYDFVYTPLDHLPRTFDCDQRRD